MAIASPQTALSRCANASGSMKRSPMIATCRVMRLSVVKIARRAEGLRVPWSIFTQPGCLSAPADCQWRRAASEAGLDRRDAGEVARQRDNRLPEPDRLTNVEPPPNRHRQRPDADRLSLCAGRARGAQFRSRL